jgi:hypothetical protein
VESARARGFGPAGQPDAVQRFPGHHGHVYDLLPPHPRHRIEIDPQLVRVIKVGRAHRMRVEVYAAEVGHPGQHGRVAGHDLLGGAPGREAQLDRLDPGRPAGRRPLLEERLPVGAVHEALEHHRPSRHAAERTVGHR